MSDVLIVEDEPMIGRILAHKLAREGHGVQRRDTADALRESVASCDVALVDTTLERDGIEEMRALAAGGRAPRAGWFALVDGRDAGEARRAVAAGAAGVITKPFKPTAVAAQVAALLELRR